MPLFGHATYLTYELGWGLPVVVLQWAAGWRLLRRHGAVLVRAIALSTAYLVAVDSIAIHNRIWTLHAGRIVGLALGNVPVEELIFFLLTNCMVAQSVVLVRHWGERRRQPTGNIGYSA